MTEQITKQIPEEGMKILEQVRQLEDAARHLSLMHSRTRREFLMAETQILERIEQLSTEVQRLASTVTDTLEIPEEERKLWALDINTGVLTKRPA